MRLISTSNKNISADWKTAVLTGLAPDGGLFLPQHLPVLPQNFMSSIKGQSLPQIASILAVHLMKNAAPDQVLQEIATEAFSLPAPLVQLTENIFCLELFHGPTAAFKDFGARFMAGLFRYFAGTLEGRHLIVLTATSGDTGSAVAQSFFKKSGIEVVILYPSGKISHLQEQQMTTLGENIHAVEIEGSFDDCQHLVKKAFLDTKLMDRLALASANSINIARLIPQSFYYFFGYVQLPSLDKGEKDTVFSVPSGNFGNICAGMIAKIIGLPIKRFIAATNANRTFSDYLVNGKFIAHPSIPTLSNAMDVGNPSNLVRIRHLYQNSLSRMKQDITSFSFNDEQTIAAMHTIYRDFDYISDPHSAIGFLGLQNYQQEHPNQRGIFLATAHPGKFTDTVYNATGQRPTLPRSIDDLKDLSKQSAQLANDYSALQKFLLQFE